MQGLIPSRMGKNSYSQVVSFWSSRSAQKITPIRIFFVFLQRYIYHSPFTIKILTFSFLFFGLVELVLTKRLRKMIVVSC